MKGNEYVDATNFIFDGKSLNDFGFIICEFNGETNTSTPSNITFTTLKVPDNDRRRFISSNYEDVVSFEFSIAKYENKKNNLPINSYEDRAMRKWLCREDGFHEFIIEQEDFYNIYYNAQINITPQMVAGRIRGYRVTVITDNVYGYTEWLETEFDINNTSPYIFLALSDRADYFYPIWEIIPMQNGDLHLKILEDINQTNTIFNSVKAGGTIIIDSENGIIEGISPDNFNWQLPRIVQGYDETVNTITSTLPCHIKIKYRLARKAVC